MLGAYMLNLLLLQCHQNDTVSKIHEISSKMLNMWDGYEQNSLLLWQKLKLDMVVFKFVR